MTETRAVSEAQGGDLRSCTVADPCGYGYNWGERPLDGSALAACGEPAIALLTFACVHEHVDAALACMTCAAEIQRIADVLVCAHCADGPAPHECRTAMAIEWLGEEMSRA